MKTTITTSEPKNGVVQVTVSGDGRNLARFYVDSTNQAEASRKAFEQHELAATFNADEEGSEDTPPAE